MVLHSEGIIKDRIVVKSSSIVEVTSP